MSRNIARIGRRRRVLNEEIMTASALGIAARSHQEESMEPGDTPRYGAGANIENHPQITDYVPRHFRAIALYVLGAMSLAITGEAVAANAVTLAKWAQVVAPEVISNQIAGGLLAWTSATVLLVAACFAQLIYSLRRHRVDDSRGRYRIWRWASWAAVALSLNAVIGAHSVVAAVAGHLTGLTVLPGNLLWWLVPAAACGGWLMLKLILESSESRLAMSCYLLATTSLVVAGIACVWSPSWAAGYQETFYRLLPVVASVMLMAGTLVFARYVVLDVQGLIEHPESPRPTSPELAVAADEPQAREVGEFDSYAESASIDDQSHDWVDGSEPEDDYEDQGNQRLSKADRKRLRKLKQRNRAA